MQFQYKAEAPLWENLFTAYVQTRDLDVTYTPLNACVRELGREVMNRYLTGMALYYHMGVASELAEKTTEGDFWQAAKNMYSTAPRGKARRYFRGQDGITCLDYLSKTFKGPTEFIEAMYRPGYNDMVKAFEAVPAFGPYFTWKMLDFYDRVLGMPVDTSGCYAHVPNEPIKGAMTIARDMGWDVPEEKSKQRPVLYRVLDLCLERLQSNGLMAPPFDDRLVGIQEVETALCGLSHYLKGSDYVGLDVDKLHDQLGEFKGHITGVMLKHSPPRVNRDFFAPPEEVVKRHRLSGLALSFRQQTPSGLSDFWA